MTHLMTHETTVGFKKDVKIIFVYFIQYLPKGFEALIPNLQNAEPFLPTAQSLFPFPILIPLNACSPDTCCQISPWEKYSILI